MYPKKIDLPRVMVNFVLPNGHHAKAICGGRMCSRFVTLCLTQRKERKTPQGFQLKGFCIKSRALSNKTQKNQCFVWIFVPKRRNFPQNKATFFFWLLDGLSHWTLKFTLQGLPTPHALVDLGDPVCTSSERRKRKA